MLSRNEFDQKYKKIDLDGKPLGEGTYGEVSRYVNNKTGEIVAIKNIKLDPNDDGLPSTALREISVLLSLDHPNIVKLYETFYSSGTLKLVFEFIEFDLRKFMKAKYLENNPRLIKEIFFQIILAMDFCHRRRIIHRDLKPNNILVTRSGHAKICDFGLARWYSNPYPRYTHEVVTTWYRAPEILLGCPKYGMAIDMWSIGCIFGELVNQNPLFAGDCEIDTIFKIFRKLGTPTEQVWPGVTGLTDMKMTFPKWEKKEFKTVIKPEHSNNICTNGLDLLEKLLCYNPVHRISCNRAIYHSYFSEIHLDLGDGKVNFEILPPINDYYGGNFLLEIN